MGEGMRDPRVHPEVGDVLEDRLGKIHVVDVNGRKGVENISWDRQPAGMARHESYRLHCTLNRWREKMAGTRLCKLMGPE